MALSLDAFHAASGRTFTCGLGKILAAVSDADRTVIQSALDDESIPHEAIARVLTANGHAIKGLTIGRHRKKRCAC
jgi:hypothetical protein